MGPLESSPAVRLHALLRAVHWTYPEQQIPESELPTLCRSGASPLRDDQITECVSAALRGGYCRRLDSVADPLIELTTTGRQLLAAHPKPRVRLSPLEASCLS